MRIINKQSFKKYFIDIFWTHGEHCFTDKCVNTILLELQEESPLSVAKIHRELISIDFGKDYKAIELIFIDNPTVSTPYIKKMLDIAKEQNLIAKITLENTVKLLLMVELDRVEQERLITIKRIKDGIQASNKQSGRKQGQLDKMTDELRKDIKQFLKDRTIKQVDLMRKHNISRNTLKKYVEIVKEETN